MKISNNKSIPAGLLLAIVLHNLMHLKGVYIYHRYERPAGRWDFKVLNVPTLMRRENVAKIREALFGEAKKDHYHYQPHPNRTDQTVWEEQDKNNDEPPYVINNYLHQPLHKKQNPWKIYAHIVCGTVPILTGALNLVDILRTSNGNKKDPLTSVSRTHKVFGYLFFVFGFITGIQGMILAPRMQFSHYRTILCSCVALLGAATAVTIVFSAIFLRRLIQLPKDNHAQRYTNILGHRVWALRAWLLMEFFLLWGRVLMGMCFLLTGSTWSFVVGGIAALLTVPLLEFSVCWHLKRTGEGDSYSVLGPLPWKTTAPVVSKKID